MTRRTAWHVVALVALVGLAVAGGFVWGERWAGRRSAENSRPPQVAPAAMPASPRDSEEPVEVSLTPDAMGRAGIKTAVVQRRAMAASITVPGTVAPNAYRETKATALVGGIVRNVDVELGTHISRGQPLAILVSTDLADAQMKYLSARAMVAAEHQKLTRTEKLVALGAASRQELEEISAVHAARETETAAARQRLLLLGLSSQQVAALRTANEIVSEVPVPAPGTGTVTARAVNSDQVVSAGQELFVIADLSTVWIIADLYEQDFATIRVGSAATVTVPAMPPVRGRVAYIDPRVDPAARTAKVRVEVANGMGALRLGMFVSVSFTAAATTPGAVVPRAAVQAVGDRSVVYVAAEGEEGRFVERTVKLGATVEDSVQVLEGLDSGERIVIEGSFYVRAEAARSRPGS
jgi:membrane fusion protein, heavy metal efflux system